MARSLAQRDAQLRAMEAARGAAAKRDKALAEHVCRWRNWEYAEDYKTESRTCRVCGALDKRDIRL